MSIICDNRGPYESDGLHDCERFVEDPCASCASTGKFCHECAEPGHGDDCASCNGYGYVEIECTICDGTGLYCGACEKAGGENCDACSNPDDPDDRDGWERYDDGRIDDGP